MPLASNPLLQSLSVAKIQSANAAKPDKATDAGADKATGFAQVYAQQASSKQAVQTKDAPDDKVADDERQGAGEDAVAAEDASLAVDGKTLPVDPPEQATEVPADASPLAVADVGTVSALIDAQLLQAATVAPTALPAPAAAADQAQAELVPPFDPSTDPLADLPAVRLALEQNAQAQGKTSAHAAASNATATTDQPEALPGQGSVNGLAAALLDKQASDSTDGEPGDKAFNGLLDDGLKDLKSAASDTRVDNFAERLATLTQAATPKTANAVPLAAPLNQPLAMHQSGWTEGLVNRVMYLSSQNLKSAEIKLEPAELGRLDIRVNLAPDQQAQVAFSSGHAGVREALEGQVHRLKDMFAEQGLGQLNVSVSDQSRGQDQGREAQRGNAPSSSRRSDNGSESVDSVGAVAEAVTPSVVLGSSVVDYYA
ncbi:flagellar hook-length control protein FliK [Pseudomonas akapageensis]|uniref:flagellar hook-length control protein FliK n=1 Tax=Pseudomonas akapageensis TaxID=2609961 RepID=UPI00140C2987|nr:flagellar hook-length control protein FliK [Pseudomonas akapageensis]